MSEANIRLLFSRLLWPGLLARERAASQLADLLGQSAIRQTVSNDFLDWIGILKFESLAANALLIPLQLKREGVQPLPRVERLIAALRYPSLLSEIILTSLGTEALNSGRLATFHSGRAAANFQINPYFNTYSSSFVPPVYDLRAQWLEDRWGIPFRRQWAYEWDIVRRRVGLGYSEPPRYFLSSRARSGNPYFDTLQSEAFRSGFLRALAWAVVDPKVDAGTADLLALTCCPLDLALWSVAAGSVPQWWPRVSINSNGIDTDAAEALETVERLWRSGCETPGMRLAYAAGSVARSPDVIYTLEIRAAFQRFLGGPEPELSDVAEFLENDVSLSTLQPGLATEGQIEPVDPSKHAAQIDGWVLVKVVFRLDPWVAPRWEAARMCYGCPVLAPYLAATSVNVTCRRDIVTFAAKNNNICQTYFWHDSLREVDVRDVPPRAGVYMLANDEAIRDFSQKNNATFCWLVTLNVYHRERFGGFENSPSRHFLGASNIIRV